jgi:hypothetical protein
MNRSARWLVRLTAPAVGAAMLLGGVPAASSAVAASGAPFAGFTDKSHLTATGRGVVASGQLPVADGSAPAGSGVSYYVDSVGGADTNDGKSPGTAWRTAAKINQTVFAPGDRILLKAGSTWSAEGDAVAKEAYDFTSWVNSSPVDVAGPDATALLAPKGSGTAGSPIVLSSYGDGPAPELNGRGVVNDVIQLTNQQHWDISNLEISNVTDGFDPSTFEPGANQGLLPGEENLRTGDLRGIHVQGENAGTLQGYDIHDVFIRDVSGVMWSIGNTGLDRSKRTGGILFEGLKGDARTVSRFQGVSVRDNIIANTAFANVGFKQFSGMGENRYRDVAPGWGDRAVAKASTTGVVTEDPNWRPHTDIEVSGNYLTNRDTEYGWDSLYLTSVQRATVQSNMIDGTGVSGIEMYYSDNVVVQDNEVAEVATRVNAADSNAIDPDRGTSNILIQYNYVHESGEGILLCGFSFSTAIVRYNVIQDVDKNYINPHGDAGVNVVYNNLMYNTQKPVRNNTVGFFQSSGSAASFLRADNRHHLLNNVFVNTREDVNAARFEAEYPGVVFSNNAYHGPKVVPPRQDPNAITGDPRIVGDPAQDIANAMIASADSPLIAAGVPVDLSQIAPGLVVTGNSTQSQLPLTVGYFGAEVTTPPAVGPATYVPAQGNGLVSGLVIDDQGDAVPGATVSYGPGTVTADRNGRYTIEAGVGQYTLRPSAEGYADGEPVPVSLHDRETLSADLVLGITTATEGQLTGRVTTSGAAVAGATVTVSRGDQTAATATTGTDGAYALTLPKGDGYTVSVDKSGYQTASQSDVVVRAARTVTVDLALTAVVGETAYAINETFDDEGTGTFTGTGDGALVARPNAVGTITIEDDAARAGNKYLKISKLTSTSGTLAVHNAVEQNLTGTVTIEARLQRTSTLGTPNQFGMYSYTESDWKPGDPATSTNPSATIALAGGNILTHNVRGTSSVKNVAPYTLGRWHTVRNVVDLGTGTFDFFVDDMTTPVLADQPLRTAVDDLDHFLFFTNGTNKSDLLVDYFRVNTGAPYDYNDSTLGAVTAQSSEGAVQLTASADGLTHSGTVHPFARTATITATAGSPFATVAVDGTEVADGVPVEIDLAAACSDDDADIVTQVPVIVTAEDGTTTSYTVSISRTNPNQLAQLRSLSVQGHELSPSFASDRHGDDNPYAITEALNTSSLQLVWDLGWANQQVQVNGEVQPAGSTGATVDLAGGQGVIEVTASSYPGDFATYVIAYTAPTYTGPDGTATISAAGGDGWYGAGATLTVAGGEGVARLQYRLGDEEWADYTAPVSLPEGSYDIGYRAQSANLQWSAVSRVTVKVDATAPAVAWGPAPDDKASFVFGSVPPAPGCTAQDAGSGPVSCVVSGYSTAVGEHSLTATATDLAGNRTAVTRHFTVTPWTIGGFDQPVDMGGVLNKVKSGRTVPLKFEVFAGATELTSTDDVKALAITGVSCSGATGEDAVETTTTGSTALRYEGGQFVYNWKTPNQPNTCLRVTVTTLDGSTTSALFKLT